jgi:hypothetical protein
LGIEDCPPHRQTLLVPKDGGTIPGRYSPGVYSSRTSSGARPLLLSSVLVYLFGALEKAANNQIDPLKASTRSYLDLVRETSGRVLL